MPFFSVVLPTYNRAHIIPETIKSVQAQRFSDWELIIVDDGSTDNTKNIVGELTAEDERIRFVFQENAERSAARNNGIDHAEGKYICFLDSDDLFKPEHLSVLKERIDAENKPVALLFTNYELLEESGTKQMEVKTYDGSPDYFIFHPVIPARLCIHRSIFDKYRFDLDSIVVEDAVICTLIALHYPVIHIEKETVYYRWHSDNSVNIKNDAYSKRLKGLAKLFANEEVRNAIPAKNRDIALNKCYINIARHHMYYKRKGKAIRTLIKASLRYPATGLKEKVYLLSRLVRNKGI